MNTGCEQESFGTLNMPSWTGAETLHHRVATRLNPRPYTYRIQYQPPKLMMESLCSSAEERQVTAGRQLVNTRQWEAHSDNSNGKSVTWQNVPKAA
jgi:hypothetical protein